MCVYSTRKQLDSPVVDQLAERLQEFKRVLPVILDLGNPSMKQRHWRKLFERLGESGAPPPKFNLGHLESAGVFVHQDFVADLASCASGEQQVHIYVNIHMHTHTHTHAHTHTYMNIHR